MLEEKKYVLFTPVGGNDPIGNEYDKDYIIKELNKQLEDGKINKAKAEELINYIESRNEPIIIEGPILHIVRHYKPKCVLLLFTNKNEDIEYKYKKLKERIEILSKDCEIMPAIKELDAKYAYNWDEPIYNFNEKMKSILNKYDNHQILINVTSTTPNITFKLCHEVINNINFNLKAIQVLISLDKLYTSVKKDKTYIESNIHYIDDFVENNINRNTEPKIYSIIKPKIQSQVRSLISVGNDLENGIYNYQALYNLLNNNSNIADELFGETFFKCIKKANDRINLIYSDNHKFSIFKEYYFAMKVKQIKGELSDFVLRITPFITELIYYFLSNNIQELKYVFYTKNGLETYIDFNNINDNILKDKLRKAIGFHNVISYIKVKRNDFPDSLYNFAVDYNNGLKRFEEFQLEANKLNEISKNKFLVLKYEINKLSFNKKFMFLNNFNNIIKKTNSYKRIHLDSNYNNVVVRLDNIRHKDLEAKKLYDLLIDYRDVQNIFNRFFKLLNKYKNDDCKDLYITIKYLCIFAEHYKNKYDENIFKLFKEFEIIEDNIRHNVAHKLINITEDDIKESCYNLSSKDILDKCEMLLSYVFEKTNSQFFYNGKIEFEYDRVNEEILNLL